MKSARRTSTSAKCSLLGCCDPSRQRTAWRLEISGQLEGAAVYKLNAESPVSYSGFTNLDKSMRNVCARTDTGKVRARNEDRFFVDAAAGIYLLADGMGGVRGGAEASRLAVNSVSETLLATELRDAATLLGAIEQANAVILNAARQNPELQGMGTTLVAALDRGSSFTIASVGDSRAYVWVHGTLRLITTDQTWVQDVGRPLGLDEETLQRHPLRHVLTMALGVAESLDVRLYKVDTEPGAYLLLSSDGLHGLVSSEDIQRILGDNPENTNTLEEKCLRLIDAARAAGGPDNITAVLIAAS